MFPRIATSDTSAVLREVQSLYLGMFPDGDPEFVERAFRLAIDCFEGRCPGFQPIDARYHNLEHTMQGTLCMARLLYGRHRARVQPEIDRRLFELGIYAILLHDSGYLKEEGDNLGSGAKYTAVHVERSTRFAAQLLGRLGFSKEDVNLVQNMIRCTGFDANLTRVPFDQQSERIVGLALGTADLLGQMAADDYIPKLPVLFNEFKEAVRFGVGMPPAMTRFRDSEDLMEKTPAFWDSYVFPKIQNDFGGLHEYLRDPYPDGPNEYLQRIEANMDRLRRRSRLMGHT